MKHLLLVIISTLFSFLLHSQTEEPSDTNKIFWSDWYRLEWSDFQGQPEIGKNIAAISNIALPYDLVSDGEGLLEVTLNVCFLKDQSWSKVSQQNKVLLQHEQLHFDIAELHRRKLVKAIAESNFTKNNYKSVLEKHIHEIWTIQYREMQDKYDKETNYSRVFKGQIKWNKYVTQQLRNLDEHKYTKIAVSLISFD